MIIRLFLITHNSENLKLFFSQFVSIHELTNPNICLLKRCETKLYAQKVLLNKFLWNYSTKLEQFLQLLADKTAHSVPIELVLSISFVEILSLVDWAIQWNSYVFLFKSSLSLEFKKNKFLICIRKTYNVALQCFTIKLLELRFFNSRCDQNRWLGPIGAVNKINCCLKHDY